MLRIFYFFILAAPFQSCDSPVRYRNTSRWLLPEDMLPLSGKVRKVQVVQDNKESPILSFWFDESGNLTATGEEYKSGKGAVLLNILAKLEYYDNGFPRSITTIDSSTGRLVALDSFEKAGVRKYKQKMLKNEYNSRGNSGGGDSIGFYNVLFYNKGGLQVRQQTFKQIFRQGKLIDEKLQTELDFGYDNQSNCILIKKNADMGESKSHWKKRYYYSANNRLDSMKEFEERKETYREIYFFDKFGNVTEKKCHGTGLVGESDFTLKYQYEYDTAGNWVKKESYNSSGNLERFETRSITYW